MSWIDAVRTDGPATVSERQLRSFGFLVGGIFLLIGLWPVLRSAAGLRWWALAPGALLATLALVAPAGLRHPHRAWMLAGHALGWCNTRLVLGLVFYLLVTPIGWVRRVLSADPDAFDPEATTYRVTKTPRASDHFNRQF